MHDLPVDVVVAVGAGFEKLKRPPEVVVAAAVEPKPVPKLKPVPSKLKKIVIKFSNKQQFKLVYIHKPSRTKTPCLMGKMEKKQHSLCHILKRLKFEIKK